MIREIAEMTDEMLLSVWDALRQYNPKEMYDEVHTMDDWAMAIHSELTIRGLI